MAIGQYGAEQIVDVHGNPLPAGTLINVSTPPGGSLATLYTDLTGGTTTPNPTPLDAYGNLTFFAADATQYGIQAIEATGVTPLETVRIPGSTATGSGTVTSADAADSTITRSGTATIAPRFAVNLGTTAGTVAAGNDTRFTTDTVVTASIASTYTLANAFGAYLLTMTGSTTITMPAATAGRSLFVVLIQDATGSRVPTFTGVKWPAGVAPTFSTGANKVDTVSFYCADGATWLAFVPGLAMA